MNPSAVSLLDSRLSLLETTFYGNVSPALHTFGASEDLNQRFAKVTTRLEQAEASLPDIAHCRALVTSLTPILTMKRSTLPAVVEKAKELLQKRDRLIENINLLQAIQTHQIPDFQQDSSLIEETQGRLNRLEVQLQAQLAESIRQASEIDMLVQLYEESMLVLRETLCAWQSRLNHIEADQATTS